MGKLTRCYDSIHMSPACEAKILAAAEKKRPRKRPQIRCIPAICALLALIVLLSPPVRAAVEEFIITRFPEFGLTIYEKPLTGGSGGTGHIIHVEEHESYAHLENGRLIFTGNGENLDITDQVSEDSPFYYTYSRDQYDFTLVVGYSGSIENFGTHDFIKKDGQWFTGSGWNYLDPETDTAYPWVRILWQDLDVPWSLPGSPS